ncbi:cytochrome P450 81Q32-like [Pistacia vera]|uniref:cytochrome P450 81Q32-like n=1 Tax=Pistacia vera TaxID=55513 RepID=UPI001263597B|nr:cytochrome P450 81Q32-like [Pistacia vera]
MEETWLFIVPASCLLCFLILKNFLLKQTRYKNRPPTPTSLPIIGHLHLVKEPIHRSLQLLSNNYGPIVSLSFGNRCVLLISSPSAAEECFSKNDILFANRPHLISGKYFSYDYTAMGAASYGPLWCNLRRLAALDIFSTNRLNMFLGIRKDEVRFLLKNLYHSSCQSFTKVEMKSKLSELSFNIIMRMVSGKRYFGEEVDDPEESKRVLKIVRDIFDASGASNPEDFLPFLRWVDYKSYKKGIIRLHTNSDRFMQSLIDEHRNTRNSSGEGATIKTIIDSMLSLQDSEPEYYTDEIIKGMIMTVLVAGTDTTSVTAEWAMSLLLNHPLVLKRARVELDHHVGHGRLAEEPDLVKLPYLQCIINETLRLFPAAPLLVPHESSDYCTIGGYDVPPSTMLIVNAWGIHRDPKVWEDPESFRPERFEGLEGEVEAYNFIPFGRGRRSCPRVGLANRVMGLALAILIQCFEWERISEEEVDLTEGTGLTMPKVEPLEAMCKARECMLNVLSKL